MNKLQMGEEGNSSASFIDVPSESSECTSSLGFKDFCELWLEDITRHDVPYNWPVGRLADKQSQLLYLAGMTPIDEPFKEFKRLLDSPKWYHVKDKNGSDLLQYAVASNSIEIFDYLLTLENFPLENRSRFGETALTLSFSRYEIKEIEPGDNYFACELIKRGVNIRDYIRRQPLLHLAVKICAGDIYRLSALKYLIDYGADINEQDPRNHTALHRCLINEKGVGYGGRILVEPLTTLLCMGADPLIRDCDGYTPFDRAIKHANIVDADDRSAIENLVYFMFDQFTKYEIPISVLLKLAKMKSPFFDEVVKSVTKVLYSEDDECVCENVSLIFTMQTETLEMLLKKFGPVIAKLFSSVHSYSQMPESYIIENFDRLFESNIKVKVINFFRNMNSFSCLERIINTEKTESAVTEGICFLLSYGLNIYDQHIQMIYRKFGYCELINLLVHMDIKKHPGEDRMDVMPRLICDITFDIQEIFNNPEAFSSCGLEHLLPYSANPKLREFFSDSPEGNFHEKIKSLPQIPLLVELARNVFRKYFIQSLRITSAKQFYAMLKLLPISKQHEKIITLETELY